MTDFENNTNDSQAIANTTDNPLQPSTSMTMVSINDISFTVEIANTDETRANGLMHRESLPAKTGMWFIFDASDNYSFWMKDTLIPLDIIFVDDQMTIVDIIYDTTPQSTELLSSNTEFQFVLELNAHEANEYGIEIGNTVTLHLGNQK